jgi:superfamily II DNA or RNA helicase
VAITLRVGNRLTHIEGASRSGIRALDAATSYRVAGFMYAPSYKRGFWDGREKLLTFNQKRGYSFPTGLLVDALACISDQGLRANVLDQRRLHSVRRKLVWNTELTLRPYQREAVRAVMMGDPMFIGTGSIKMPARSGKTRTAAYIIRLLGVRTLFIVPSQMLLRQTHKVLSEAFTSENIGIIGDSECDIQFITVATIQTLALWRGRKKQGDKPKVPPDPRYTELIENTDCVLFDEVHHVSGGGEWHKAFHDFDARFKIGMSATLFLDNSKEQERGIIWAKATCGGVRIDVSESRLIQEGYLMKQNVRLFTVRRPDLNGKRWSQSLRRKAITCNVHRNTKIAMLAKKFNDKGFKTVIVSNRLEQIAILCEMMDDRGIRFETVTGADNRYQRDEKVEGFVDGEYHVLIGTVLGEGIDIPAIEVVINAEGGEDLKNVIQRMRNLTMLESKRTAILVDFLDETNEYFRKHSKARLEAYQSQQDFSVEVVS